MNKTSLVTRLLQFGTLPEKYIREISKYFSVVPLWNGHQNRHSVCVMTDIQISSPLFAVFPEFHAEKQL